MRQHRSNNFSEVSRLAGLRESWLQVLLVACSGSLTRSLPVMSIAYWGILVAWLTAVDKLAEVHGGALSKATTAHP